MTDDRTYTTPAPDGRVEFTLTFREDQMLVDLRVRALKSSVQIDPKDLAPKGGLATLIKEARASLFAEPKTFRVPVQKVNVRYAVVAEIYAAACADPAIRNQRQAVLDDELGKRFFVSDDEVKSAIREARNLGYLTAAPRQREAGGELTDLARKVLANWRAIRVANPKGTP